jgi:hypothetical protein
MSGEMITKLLSLLTEIVRHPINAMRPLGRFQKRFEWQSEFLFFPMTRACGEPDLIESNRSASNLAAIPSASTGSTN